MKNHGRQNSTILYRAHKNAQTWESTDIIRDGKILSAKVKL